MSSSDWQQRRQEWTDAEAAERYDKQRFSSAKGRRKHGNDIACLLSALSTHLRQATGDEQQTILDLPCGTGRLHTDLRSAGYRVPGSQVLGQCSGSWVLGHA